MKNSDLIISQIRQRLEILYQMVDELEENGGSNTYTNAIKDLVDSGAKNVLDYTEIGTNSAHGTTYESNGVTFTLNSDGTITVTRTAPATVDSSCNLRTASGSLYIDNYCNGNYVLSGCPNGGGDVTYSLRAIRDTYRPTDTGDGVVLPDKGTYSNIYINMLVSAYFEGSVTFKPMVCSKTNWDVSQEYQPYVMSNAELTARVKALEGGV